MDIETLQKAVEELRENQVKMFQVLDRLQKNNRTLVQKVLDAEDDIKELKGK